MTTPPDPPRDVAAPSAGAGASVHLDYHSAIAGPAAAVPSLRVAKRLYPFRYVLLAVYLLGLAGLYWVLMAEESPLYLRAPWTYVVGGSILLYGLQAAFLSGAPHLRWPRPTGRRSMRLSLAAGALMAGVLSVGFAGTAVSFFRIDNWLDLTDKALTNGRGSGFEPLGMPWQVPAFVLLAWAGWFIIFAWVWVGQWFTIFRRVYALLFAGTWLELLVTIPVDIQVRKRTKCYCGEGTFLAMNVGLVTALWSFGPGIVLLFFTRRLQRRADLGVCTHCGYDLRGLPEPRCPECGTAFDPSRHAPPQGRS